MIAQICFWVCSLLYIVMGIRVLRDYKQNRKRYENAIDDYIKMRVELENAYYEMLKGSYDALQEAVKTLKINSAPEEFISFYEKESARVFEVLAKVSTQIETSKVSDPKYAVKCSEVLKHAQS